MPDISKITIGEVTYDLKDTVARESGGGGGGGSDPDGTTAITRDSNGKITQLVLTYSGGVRTTTFSESNGTKTIVETDIKTGAATKTVKTITISSSQATQTTQTLPVS